MGQNGQNVKLKKVIVTSNWYPGTWKLKITSQLWFLSLGICKKSCITRYCIKEFINFREIKEFSKFTIFVKETFQVRHQLKFCIICSLKVGLKPKFRSHIFDLKHIELKTFLGVIYLLLKQLSRTWVLLRSENIIWVVSGSVRQLLFPTQDLNQFLEKSQKILGNPRIYSQKIPILGFFIFMGFTRNPY